MYQSTPEDSELDERPGAGDNYKKFTFYDEKDPSHQEQSVAFMIALDLLQAGADVHVTADIFTPLHCAAGSGWVEHVNALLHYGAHYEFIAKCNPACLAAVKAADGRIGAKRVLALLQKKMGPFRWKIGKEWHDCLFNGMPEYSWPKDDFVNWYVDEYVPNLSRGFLPGSKDAVDIKQGFKLCRLCRGIFDFQLASKPGYLHATSLQELAQLAESCAACGFFWSLLKSGRHLENNFENNQIILRSTTDPMSNGATSTFRLQLAEGCYCKAGEDVTHKSQAYKECQNTLGCRMMLLEDIAIDMFTSDGKCPISTVVQHI